jgi:hypothetical protein
MQGFYEEQYPAIREVLGDVTAVVEKKVECIDEVELRFGTQVQGRFNNGVTQDFFEKSLSLVEEYDGWSSHDEDWRQTVDYFYLYKGQQIRSRVNDTGPVETIRKTVLGQRDIREDSSTQMLRVQVSREMPVVIGANDDLGSGLTFLRLKQQRRFSYKEWNFEFAKVWCGSTFQEADRAFFTKVPASYEMEIESLSNRGCAVQTSVSLLLKALDFLSEESTFH